MTSTALAIRDLHKTYPNGFTALHRVDLTVEVGEFYALLGPNGAGKSTLISILCSLTHKTQGQVQVFGVDIDQDFPRAKRQLGLVPQEFNFNLFETVLNTVMNQAGFYGVPRRLAATRAEQYLTQLGLWDKRHEPARALSGGMKRRLMIARALLHEPPLLILDEPTAGVDIELRRGMWQFLRDLNAQGTTLILTTHYLEEAENLCRRIAIIDQGRIVEDTTMRALLDQLSVETFVLNLREPLATAPNLGNYPWRRLDDTTFEVDVEKHDGMNGLFAALNAANIPVVSLRNKSNRLEELFLQRVAANSTRPTPTEEKSDAVRG